MAHLKVFALFALSLRVSIAQDTNATASTNLTISADGNCGGTTGQTCLGSTYGDCCSQGGYCGGANDYCSPSGGCQSAFGTCSTNSSYISFDGRCGSTDANSQICIGSSYGSCCSAKGWCGSTSDYCGTGCQSGFGTCGGSNLTSSIPSVAISSSSSASAATSAPASANSADPEGSDLTQNTDGKSSKLAIILGAVLGVFALLCLLAGAYFVIRRRRYRSKKAELGTPDYLHDHKEEPRNSSSRGPVPVYEAPIETAIEVPAYKEAKVQEPVELASPNDNDSSRRFR